MDVRVEMHGSAGYSNVNEANDESGLQEVFGFLKQKASNGLVINGLLTWIDVQQKTTPPNIWLTQAASAFNDDEVEIAKAALWKSSSSSMIRVFPAFHCDKDKSDITDVLAKVKVVEESFRAVQNLVFIEKHSGKHFFPLFFI